MANESASLKALKFELATVRAENARLANRLHTLENVTAPRVHEAIRESEVRWQLANNGLGDGIWEFHHQTGEAFFTKGYKRMLGYSDEEFPNQYSAWVNSLHPDDLAHSLSAAAAYVNGTSARYLIEHRMRCKNGEYKWILAQGVMVQRDADGKPLISAGTHTDISEIKQAETALSASSLRLATTISNLQEGVLLEDENRRIVLTNDTFCQMFGVPVKPAQMVGADCSTSAEESKPFFVDEVGFVNRINELLKRRELVLGDELALKDGRVLRRDFVPIFGSDSYAGHLWKYQDITARKHAEESLRRREEKYRGIIENMNLGLLEVDLNEHIIYANQSFCQMTGFTLEELLGKVASQVMLKGDYQEMMDEKNRSRRDGISDAYEIATKNKRGELRWLLISGAPLYDDQRALIGSIGIHLDITHQKKLEVRLREAKKQAEESAWAKEMFLANMSHEIRTPLNAIIGMARLLTGASLNIQQAGYLQAIITSAENLTVIVNDILDLTKIEAGKVDIEKIGFPTAALCQQIEKTLRYRAEEKGLVFSTKIDPNVPNVLIGDPHRLTQVLLNLAGNAVKFTESGRVEVSCDVLDLQKSYVTLAISVSDTGIGIEPEYLTRIFSDFSQEDPSITRKFGGTGLGLSISRRLVDLLGGQLQIESEKGRGTKVSFCLQLPIGTPADVPPSPAGTTDPARFSKLHGKRILLVEDNEFNRILARAILDDIGLNVTEAENGAAAVTLAFEQPFDLVLMDVQMPVMNGFEATAILRGQPGPRLPIVALTANAIKGERERCLEAGMDDYLAKPFSEEDLLACLFHWLTNPAEEESEEAAPLYQLDFLLQTAHGNQAFVQKMLHTFLQTAQQTLFDWQIATDGLDAPRIQALAHRLKPSLTHLRIQTTLPLAEQLENWAPLEINDLFWRIAAKVPPSLQAVVNQISAAMAVD